MSVYIIGLDVSSTNTGYSLGEYFKEEDKIKILNKGNIIPKKHWPLWKRAIYMGKEFEKILSKYREEGYIVKFYSIEDQYSRNTRTIKALSKSAGSIFMAIGKVFGSEIKDFQEYYPSAIKLSLTGDGHSTKEQMVQKVLDLHPDLAGIDDNVADSIGAMYTFKNKELLKWSHGR